MEDSPTEIQEEKKKTDAISINEMKESAMLHFSSNQKLSYKDYENNILRAFDIDPEINYCYLLKLYEFYEENRVQIDKENREDEIAKTFFQYAITLTFKNNQDIKKKLTKYCGKLIMENEISYFWNISTKKALYEIIKSLLDLKPLTHDNIINNLKYH